MTNQMTKARVIQLRNRVNAALAELAELEGVEIHAGNASFNDAECTFKLNIKIPGATTREESMLEMYMSMDGLQRRGKNGGELIEYHTRKPKFPYIYVLNGKRYKTSRAHAKMLFAA